MIHEDLPMISVLGDDGSSWSDIGRAGVSILTPLSQDGGYLRSPLLSLVSMVEGFAVEIVSGFVVVQRML